MEGHEVSSLSVATEKVWGTATPETYTSALPVPTPTPSPTPTQTDSPVTTTCGDAPVSPRSDIPVSKERRLVGCNHRNTSHNSLSVPPKDKEPRQLS